MSAGELDDFIAGEMAGADDGGAGAGDGAGGDAGGDRAGTGAGAGDAGGERQADTAAAAADAGKDGKQAADAAADDKRPKYVPHEALHEARQELKELKAALAERDLRMARIDERLRILNGGDGQGGQDGKQPPKGPPSLEEDPVGRVAHIDKTVGDLVARQAAEDQDRALFTTYTTAARDFSARTPDFGDAYNFLATNRDAELQAMGIKDPAARQAMIFEGEKTLVRHALSNGLNPAELVYSVAKARGFAPKPAGQDAATAGTAAAAAAGGAGQQSAADRIAHEQKVAGASRSLSGAGGAAVELTADALANMSDEEFANVSEAQWRRAMGG